MTTPFSTNNPGIGGIDELTAAEEALIESIASLGSAGQVLTVNGGATGVEWTTLAASGDVSAASNFGTDNVLIKSDGTEKGVQATGITIADTTDAMSGMASITIDASGSLLFGAVTVLSDSAGTTTLQNIDAIDATTEATIEAAIDTLANLTSVQGLTVTLADAGANAIFGWDDIAGAYENLSQAEVLAVIGNAAADATTKGVATFNASNFSASSGVINTIQDIGTSANPQFATIELGAATDTTISRVSAGLIAVEGDTVALLTATQTLSGKTLTSPTITTSPTAAGATWTDLGAVTTVDINGGTIDGVTIGGAAAGAITGTTIDGTTITASTGFALGDGDYVGITSNERLVFNAAGNITVTGANLALGDNNITGIGSASFTQELDNGSKTASFSIDFVTDQKQKVTLTANTMTLTLDTTSVGVGNYLLKIVNGGLATLTWASETGSVFWPGGTAPTLTSSGTDIVTFYFDGTNWYGVASLAFS